MTDAGLLSAGTIALVLGSFVLGGLVKGAIGMGLPVVVLTLLVFVMPLKEAIAIFLIPGIASNLWQATSGPYLPDLFRRLWPFLLGSIAGIVIGVFATADAPTDRLVGVLGGMLIAYAVFSLTAPPLPSPGRHEPWLSPVAGALGGVFFGMVGVFTVPGLLYLETLKLPRDKFVQGMGLTFVTISSTLMVSMAGFSLVSGRLAVLSVLGLVPALIGLALGRRIRRRIPEAFYRKLFFYALIASGAYMIAESAGALG